MKIKRFFAADMKQAIRLVREDIGPDAVILSNERVRGGIEIIAAVDYDEALSEAEQAAPAVAQQKTAVTDVAALQRSNRDATLSMTIEERAATLAAAEPKLEATPVVEAPFATTPEPSSQRPKAVEIEWSPDPALNQMQQQIQHLRGMMENQLTGLAWGEMERNQPARTELVRRLSSMGVQISLIRKLVESVAVGNDVEQGWRQLLLQLGHSIPIAGDDDFLDHGGVVALVGSTGVGKTTTIAKLAARFALRHGNSHVAMVTTDSYRIGAHEQLRTYGQILNVPVHVANSTEELRSVLKALSDKKLVLIDTAGMSQRDMRITEQFATLHKSSPLIQTYLVLSATTQMAVLSETVNAYRDVELDGCIVTKLDESASLGGVISTTILNDLPVTYVTDGQRVPEDIHPARAHTLIKHAVEFMQAQESVMDDEELALAYGGKLVHAHA